MNLELVFGDMFEVVRNCGWVLIMWFWGLNLSFGIFLRGGWEVKVCFCLVFIFIGLVVFIIFIGDIFLVFMSFGGEVLCLVGCE